MVGLLSGEGTSVISFSGSLSLFLAKQKPEGERNLKTKHTHKIKSKNNKSRQDTESRGFDLRKLSSVPSLFLFLCPRVLPFCSFLSPPKYQVLGQSKEPPPRALNISSRLQSAWWTDQRGLWALCRADNCREDLNCHPTPNKGSHGIAQLLGPFVSGFPTLNATHNWQDTGLKRENSPAMRRIYSHPEHPLL